MINLRSPHGESELVIIIRNPELYIDLGAGGNFFSYMIIYIYKIKNTLV